MKKYMIIGTVLISSMIFAQAKQPKLEIVDNEVKATYFYENGQIQQQGYFKDGKLEGSWLLLMKGAIKNQLVNILTGRKPENGFFGMINH